jgi:hypothetical protein
MCRMSAPRNDHATARPHDALFRSGFEHPADAAGELLHVLPKALAAALDPSSLKPKLALWFLRDARRPATLLHNLGLWADTLREVAQAADAWRATLILLRYLDLVVGRERFHDFCDKLVALAPMTEEILMTALESIHEEGREQGREEGRREMLLSLVVKQLSLKFGPLDAATLDRLERAAPAELERTVERILCADTLAAALAT